MFVMYFSCFNLFAQPGFRHQELLVPGMRRAVPRMPDMHVLLVQQQHQGSCPLRRRTNAGVVQKGPQTARPMPSQVRFALTCATASPTNATAGMSQPVPVGALASSLANASLLNRGRCLVKFCTRL